MIVALFISIIGLFILYILLCSAARMWCRHAIQVREWDADMETVTCAACGAILDARMFVSKGH